MLDLNALLEAIRDPEDYFHGVGTWASLPTPRNVLLFVRRSREALQQNALGNRSHHRFVFLVCVKTAGDVHIDHRQVRLEPGQGLLIPPYRFHHYSHLETSRLEWVYCTFEMEEDLWSRGMPSVAVRLTPEGMTLFSGLCALWSARRGTPERLQVKVLEILMLFREAETGQGNVPQADPKDNLLGEVNRMLAGSAGQTIRVEELAEALGLSVSHIRLRFREISGVSLGRYLENFRLNRAMELLKNSRESVGEISRQAGYASPQAFHRAFRRLTGETPLAYRRRSGRRI